MQLVDDLFTFIFGLDHGSTNFYPGGVNPEDDIPDS